LVVKYHILEAAMDMLGMENVNSITSKYITDPENVWMLTTEEREKKILLTISIEIFDSWNQPLITSARRKFT